MSRRRMAGKKEMRRSQPRDPSMPVTIRRLPTGVPGLDEILGGEDNGRKVAGFPEFSFTIIAGAPGSGKTTLAHQFLFANASAEVPALYFTILGEPAIKMLRYQQQYSFFDQTKLNGAIQFVNLSETVLNHDLDVVLEQIIGHVERTNAKIVVVDSFRTVARKMEGAAGEQHLQTFVQRLALHLTSLQATSFLIGEYADDEMRDNPVFTVADGILWLYQIAERNSVVRKLRVLKMRGQGSVPGLHFFRISRHGLQCFPRTFGLSDEPPRERGARRVSTGIAKLDDITYGGLPEGDSVLVAGPSGTGKSLLGSRFIDAGLEQREPGVIAIFEETVPAYVRRAKLLGFDFETAQKKGLLEIIYLRPLDLSVDETVHEVISAVKKLGAKRVVIDSLAGFELALAPGFRTDFRESLYRMIGALSRQGVTIMSTVEIEDKFTSFDFSKYVVSFLADDLIRLRYVSIEGQLRKMLAVIKMRSSQHSIDLWEYSIARGGVKIGEPLRGFRV